MSTTLNSRIILVFVVGLALTCAGMLMGFTLVMGDALPGSTIMKALLIGGGITVLLAVLGSIYIHNRLSPIRNIVLYARAVAAGEENAKLDI